MGKIWKPIKGYEGYYEISNYGDIKSIKRVVQNSGSKSGFMTVKERIMKWRYDTSGYPIAGLSKSKKLKTIAVHILVWDHFGGKPRESLKIQIDHIDKNKSNPRIDNLRLLSQPVNILRNHKDNLSESSKHPGVHWDKDAEKWRTRICIRGIRRNIGLFNNEKEAASAYMKAREAAEMEVYHR